MTNEIENHTEQAKFRSSVDEILRMSPLTKKELYEVIQECYLEDMRLQGVSANQEQAHKEYLWLDTAWMLWEIFPEATGVREEDKDKRTEEFINNVLPFRNKNKLLWK